MATIKTAPIDNKNTLKESMDKLNKNIEKLIEQKQKATVKTNSGVDTNTREQKLKKLEDTREDKIREENRKLRDSLGDSLLPKDIRNPGINALAGGLLGIDPAVIQAFGVDKAVGSLWNNIKTKRRINQDNRIQSQRIKKDYQTINQPTEKAKHGSVIKESEETVYAKHFNELNKTLKEGFGNKKQNETQKKEESGFFAKVLGFLVGPMMKLITGVLLGMVAVRGINLLWNKFANSWLGRRLGLSEANPKETGRDANGRKNNLSFVDLALDSALGVGVGAKALGKNLIETAGLIRKKAAEKKILDALTSQERVAAVAKNPEYVATGKELAKHGIYENKGVYGALNKAQKANIKSPLLKKTISTGAKTTQEKVLPAIATGVGKAFKWGGKAITAAAVPLQVGLGAWEAGSAFTKGDNRGGYGAIAGTGGALGGAILGQMAIPIPILGAVIGAVAGDLLARKTSNAIYDANHPEEIPINTDQEISRTAQLEETQRYIEQLKRENDFQRSSMESLENIEKILKENQYQDKAYYNEDLKNKFQLPWNTNERTDNGFAPDINSQIEEMRNIVFPEIK